ncbi:phenylalanine--tRNA ligase subunit alpha, partial [Candidatus Zixiibacteriota bacterium]
MSSLDYEALAAEARQMFGGAADERELEEARVAWIGRKGRITTLLRQIPDLPDDERPVAGRNLNVLKREITAIFEA